MFDIVAIINNVTGFLKNLNLSKKDVVIIFCVIGIATASWSANHYRGKSNRLESALTLSEDALRIEKDKPKLEDNLDWINRLKKDNKELDKSLQDLWTAYDALNSGGDAESKKYMEILEYVKTVEEACKEFSDIGFDICDDIIVDGR